jgi:hypothetical protein
MSPAGPARAARRKRRLMTLAKVVITGQAL